MVLSQKSEVGEMTGGRKRGREGLRKISTKGEVSERGGEIGEYLVVFCTKGQFREGEREGG